MEDKPKLPPITSEEYYTLSLDMQRQYDDQINRKIDETQYKFEPISAQEYADLPEDQKLMYSASCRKRTSEIMANIHPDLLNPPKPRFLWIRTRIQLFKEYYYAFTKGKYYIQRYQIREDVHTLPNGQKVGAIDWMKYLVQETTYPYSYTWQDKPKFYYRTIMGMLIVKKLNKHHPEFTHSLIDIREHHWVDYVMNGPSATGIVGTARSTPNE